jgi:dTMP kinase
LKKTETVTRAKTNKGLLITFEGGEGAGKSTLIRTLYHRLKERGFHPTCTREPGGTGLGVAIRDLLLHQSETSFGKKGELFLFLADRAQHVEEVILPELKRGGIVLSDRFTDSTLAYQGAARSLPSELLEPLCHFAASDLIPDLTFLLDIDPNVGLLRSCKENEHDRIERKALLFHIKVREAFLQLAEKNPNRFCVIDGTLSPEKVFEKAFEELQKQLEKTYA